MFKLQSLARAASALVFVGSLLASQTASATSFFNGTIAAIDPLNTPGAVLADPLRPFTISFGGGLSISGQAQDRVVKLADGTLSFDTYLRNITGSAGSRITGFGRYGFTDLAEQVTYDPTSLGSAIPESGSRSGSLIHIVYGTAADGLGIGLTNPVADGNKFLDIATRQTAYAQVGDMFIEALGPNNQFGSVKLQVFAPIPEPGTWALALVGLAGLIMSRRQRRDCRDCRDGAIAG
jgi:hypothetical protein